MTILESDIQLVNEQIDFHKNYAQRCQSKYRAEKHIETASRFEQLLDHIRQTMAELEKLKGAPETGEGALSHDLRLSLTPDELEGLPETLLNELSSTDRTEYLILNILEDVGGIASLDQILVGIYRRTGEVLKRNTLTSRLYRMAQRNLIHGVPGKKGAYSLQPLSKDDDDPVSEEVGTAFS